MSQQRLCDWMESNSPRTMERLSSPFHPVRRDDPVDSYFSFYFFIYIPFLSEMDLQSMKIKGRKTSRTDLAGGELRPDKASVNSVDRSKFIFREFLFVSYIVTGSSRSAELSPPFYFCWLVTVQKAPVLMNPTGSNNRYRPEGFQLEDGPFYFSPILFGYLAFWPIHNIPMTHPKALCMSFHVGNLKQRLRLSWDRFLAWMFSFVWQWRVTSNGLMYFSGVDGDNVTQKEKLASCRCSPICLISFLFFKLI